jgi:hypothetical protein
MGSYNTTTTTIGHWGSTGDFAVHASVYGKVQVGPSVDTQRKIEGRRKEACCFAQAGLSSYLYGLLVTCIHLPVLDDLSTPPHYPLNNDSTPKAEKKKVGP